MMNMLIPFTYFVLFGMPYNVETSYWKKGEGKSYYVAHDNNVISTLNNSYNTLPEAFEFATLTHSHEWYYM